MAQQIKVSAARPDDLRSGFRTDSDLHKHTEVHAHLHKTQK